VHDDKIIVARLTQDFGEIDSVRHRIDQLALRNHGGRLCQPHGLPEGSDLAPCLIARTRAAVEPFIGGNLQKQGPHHGTTLEYPARCRPFEPGFLASFCSSALTAGDRVGARLATVGLLCRATFAADSGFAPRQQTHATRVACHWRPRPGTLLAASRTMLPSGRADAAFQNGLELTDRSYPSTSSVPTVCGARCLLT
jgi:hypothetical protein